MKKKYILENLDCPNCANKLERKIKTIDKLHDATIDFMHLTLHIDCDENDLEEIIEKVRKIIEDFEPGVVLKEYKKHVHKEHHHENHEHHHDHKHHHEHKECCHGHHGHEHNHNHHHDYEGCCHGHHDHEHHHNSNECCCEGHHHEHQEHHEHSNTCGCGHDHSKVFSSKLKIILMVIAFVVFLVPTIFNLNEYVELGLYIVAYLLVGLEILYKSLPWTAAC